MEVRHSFTQLYDDFKFNYSNGTVSEMSDIHDLGLAWVWSISKKVFKIDYTITDRSTEFNLNNFVLLLVWYTSYVSWCLRCSDWIVITQIYIYLFLFICFKTKVTTKCGIYLTLCSHSKMYVNLNRILT